MRSSLPEENGSLLDDKVRTQEGAVSSSGGACGTSFFPEDLRQQQDKNAATLGTALPANGARRRKRNLLQHQLLTTSLLRGALSRKVRNLQQLTLGQLRRRLASSRKLSLLQKKETKA